jgi:uncharacterized membrane protein
MATANRIIGYLLAGLLLLAGRPAYADLKLCNRLSYVVDAAIAVEDNGAAASRGWVRLNPGECQVVLQGAIPGEHLYVHARALPSYGPSPLPRSGHADLCVGEKDFVIAAARSCARGQRLARFTEIKPAETSDGLLAALAEEADYTDDQARLAGIQRLLMMSGYDAGPIDGVTGRKTEAALAQFLKERGLAATAVDQPGFFDTLLAATQQPAGSGLSWCNDTPYPVMAALGADEKGAIVTRGWYRVEPGKCLRPDLPPQTRRLYSFAEAIDADGRTLSRGGKALAWGGSTMLCTREAKFELGDQRDCAARGLNATGFAPVDLPAKAGMTVRFRE